MVRRLIRASDKIAAQELDGEIIILNLATEWYIALNNSATEMWKTLIETGSVEQTKDRLVEQYDVDSETLWNDVEQFIDKLLDYQLIEVEVDEST
jgi:hypothetical protein